MAGLPRRVCSTKISPKVPSLVLLRETKWENMKELKIRFLSEDQSVRDEVMHHASEWLEHVSLKFIFVDSGYADIRIHFNSEGIHNSLVGTEALLEKDQNKPTMNLGLLDPKLPEEEVMGTVLHEFGHALGCGHEHQHPKNGIKWNRDNVYADYICKIGWKASAVDYNVLNAHTEDETHHSKVDLESVMMYWIPKEHLESGEGFGGSNKLSELDKKFIRTQYP